EKMLPGRDYDFSVSGSGGAIRGLLTGKYEVVAVANDYLPRIESEVRAKWKAENKEIPNNPYRSIYKSEVTYPPFCFAYVHDLKPELAAKVREAFLEESYRFSGPLKDAYAKANQTRFVAASYKENWKDVREVDRKLVEMFGQKK